MDTFVASLDSLIRSLPQVDDPLNQQIQVESNVSSWYEGNPSIAEDPSVRNPVIELAAKRLLYKYSKENSIVQICGLLDTALYMAQGSKCEASLAHFLIEDLFDIQTTDNCQVFWPYMESRENALAHNLTGTRAPGTTLIRMCNALVRRLSKNHDAHFSGRIATYLSRAFLLNEKSGLNIRGSFNTENVTVYDRPENGVEMTVDVEVDVKETEVDGDVKMSATTEEKVTEKTSSEKPGNDKDLDTYTAFWSLQEYFSNPPLLFEEPHMQKCQNLLNVVSDTLKGAHSYKKRARHLVLSKQSENDDDDAVFIPKWLTRRDLFDLQLKDPSFRLAIISQICILCDFMLSLGEDAKEKWTDIKATNKSVMFPFTLSEEDTKFFSDLNRRWKDKLNDDFGRTFGFIMNRDKTWQLWKLRNCPPFEQPKLQSQEYGQAAETLEALKAPRKRFWHSMGTAALTKLWKVETGLEKLRNPEQYSVPEAEFYYAKLQQVEEAQGYEKKETSNSDELDKTASITWRGLRAARDHGMWLKFGKVNRKDGFAGLFGVTQPEARSETPKKEPETETETHGVNRTGSTVGNGQKRENGYNGNDSNGNGQADDDDRADDKLDADLSDKDVDNAEDISEMEDAGEKIVPPTPPPPPADVETENGNEEEVRSPKRQKTNM